MKKYIFFTLLILLQVNFLMAQTIKRCATMEYIKRLTQQDPTLEGRLQQNEQNLDSYIQQHPDLRMSDAIVTIPVVFHILYYNSSQNVSDLRIMDQVATLNKDYARQNADTSNTPTSFKTLASG